MRKGVTLVEGLLATSYIGGNQIITPFSGIFPIIGKVTVETVLALDFGRHTLICS